MKTATLEVISFDELNNSVRLHLPDEECERLDVDIDDFDMPDQLAALLYGDASIDPADLVGKIITLTLK